MLGLMLLANAYQVIGQPLSGRNGGKRQARVQASRQPDREIEKFTPGGVWRA